MNKTPDPEKRQRPLTTVHALDRANMAGMVVFAASANILPISLVRISRDLNFSLSQAGVISFAGAWIQFFILFLSGFLAARFGKILLVKLALFTIAVGLALLAVSTSYYGFLVLFVFLVFGQGIMEGLLTPLAEDLHPKDNGRHMNMLHSFWPLGVLLCVLGVGELLSRGISWRILYLGLGAITFLIAFLYPRAKRINLPASQREFKSLWNLQQFTGIVRRPLFWMIGAGMFFGGGIEGGFAFWSASYIQLHFEALPRAGAFGAAAFALGMMLGRYLSSYLAHKIGLQMILQVAAIIGLLISMSFFYISSLWVLYIFMLTIGIIVGPLWPSLQSYGAKIITVDPTMLMVMFSCFGIPGYSSATLIMGILGDHYGLHTSFIIAPLYLLFLFLAVFLARSYRRRNP